MSIPRFSIRRPVAVAMLALAVVFLGLISFRRLPIDLLPDVAYPKLVIHTGYPDVGPAETERFVSEPIEQAVATVPGVERVESVSREGVSLVTLRFAWGTDMDFALLGVREKLDNVRGALPELASRPTVLRVDPQSEPVMAVSAAGGRDLRALRELAETVFRRRLEQIDGVAQAAVTGGEEREIQVEADPVLLESYGLTLADLAAALDAANASAPGGTVRSGRFRYALRTLGEFQDVDEIGDVPVGANGAAARTNGAAGGGVVTLRDVARITDGFRERESVARYGSSASGSATQRHSAEAVGLLVFKDAGANTVRVAERVEAALERLRAEYPEVTLRVAVSQAGFVSEAIDNVVGNLIGGAVLAFLVLLLFLRDVRYPVGVALASLGVALTVLPALAARWGAGAAEGAPAFRPQSVRSAARRSFAPVRRVLAVFDRGFARFAAGYERTLAAALEHRGRVVGLAALALGLAAVLGISLERGVLPDVDQGAFLARLELPRGTPLEQTEVDARRLEDLFLADPAVEAVFTRVGRQSAVTGIEAEETGLNTALLEVRLRENASTTAALERIRPHLAAAFPPGALALEAGRATALGQLLGGGEADLAVRVRGDDLGQAAAYARRVEARLARVPALANVRLAAEAGQPEIQVEIHRERAAAYGIEPRAVADAIERAMRGRVATEYVDFDRKVPVVVRLPEAERRSLRTLETLRVDGIPLRELIVTRTTEGPAEIRRLEQSRVTTVYADVASGGLDGAIRSVRGVLADLPAPAGTRVEIGGENEEMRNSFRDLGFAFAVALLLVYMILAAEFESLVHPLIVLLSVPLGLVGAILALWITGAGLNTMSLIGLVVLVGIVDNDAVVKVDFINRMRRRGLPLREAILAAGHARLRPILMTTLTTMLGLLPMAFAGGRGAELRAPLAIAIFGGLFSATALTLIVIPVVYDLVEEGRTRLRTRARRDTVPTAAKPTPTPEPIPGD